MELDSSDYISIIALFIASVAIFISHRANKISKHLNNPEFKKRSIEIRGKLTYYRRNKELNMKDITIRIKNDGGKPAYVKRVYITILFKKCIFFKEFLETDICNNTTGPNWFFKQQLENTYSENGLNECEKSKEDCISMRKELENIFENKMKWYTGHNSIPTLIVKIEYVGDEHRDRDKVECYEFNKKISIPGPIFLVKWYKISE